MMSIAGRVHEAISKVCEVDSVSIGNRKDKDTWVIHFGSSATKGQKKKAQAIVDAFDIDAVDPSAINVERARRIAAGRTINNMPMQLRDEDIRNLQSLAFNASLFMDEITEFRDANNKSHQLGAPEILSLWEGTHAYISDVYKASWALKAMEPVPADFADDKYWP